MKPRITAVTTRKFMLNLLLVLPATIYYTGTCVTQSNEINHSGRGVILLWDNHSRKTTRPGHVADLHKPQWPSEKQKIGMDEDLARYVAEKFNVRDLKFKAMSGR